MARKPRIAPGGFPQHVLNRAAGRLKIFGRDKDFLAFENLLIEAHQRFPIPILSWCLMSTHWHFVVFPERDDQITAFFRWLTHTHAMRWRTAHRTVGYGALYQGRFKSFLIERDEHLRTVCRYVERNALTAGLVKKAQDWPWSSLHVREQGRDELRAILADWPVSRRTDWVRHVNQPLTTKEATALALSLRRNRPFGRDDWTIRVAAEQNLGHTLRREGRPCRSEETP